MVNDNRSGLGASQLRGAKKVEPNDKVQGDGTVCRWYDGLPSGKG